MKKNIENSAYLGIKRSKKKESNIDNESDLKEEEKFQTKVNYSHSLYLKKNLLVKKVFLYRPMYSLPILSNYIGELIEYRISHEFLNLNNKELKENRLYGSDIYTSDSDPILILMHLGCIDLGNIYLNSEGNEDGGISLILRVGKGRVSYNSSEKNNIKSRKPTSYLGHSVKPEGFFTLNNIGTDEELYNYSSSMPLVENEIENLNIICKDNYEHLPELNPYKMDFNIPLTFNLSFELVYAYDITLISDNTKNKFKEFLSYKLNNNDMYIENSESRFRISKINRESINVLADSNSINIENKIKLEDINDLELFDEYHRYKLSKIENIERLINFDDDQNPYNKNIRETVIYNNLDWSDIIWSEEYIRVNDYYINNPKNFVLIDLQ